MGEKRRFSLNEKLFHRLLNNAKNQFSVIVNGETYIVSVSQKSYFTSEKFIAMHEDRESPEILDYRDVERAIVDGNIFKFSFTRKVKNKFLRLFFLD